MKTVDDWKSLLRAKVRVALGAKDKPALTVLRETLAAIENAEATPLTNSPSVDGAFAGSAGVLGAGEAARLVLSPEAVLGIVERELRERREAASEYARLGRHDEAAALTLRAELLAAIAAEG